MKNMFLKLLLVTCLLLFVPEVEAVTISLDYEFRNIFNLEISKEESIRILEEEIIKNSQNHNLHFVLGFLYAYLQNDFQKAEKEFVKAIKVKPDYYLSYMNSGYVILGIDNSRIGEAIAYFKKALKYAPDKSVIYNALAASYMVQNKPDEAKNILEEGIKIIDNDESLYFNQALILMKHYQGTKEQEKVIRNMKRVIKLSPKEEYFFILGIFYLQKQNNEESREAFKQTIGMNPKNIYAILGLATTYKNTNQYEKAIEIAKQALAIDPENKDIHAEIKEYEEAYKKWKEKQNSLPVKK